MPVSQIKIRRAMARADIGRYPGSATAMLDLIPTTVAATLTSAQLAIMLDAMWTACRRSKAIALADALDEGAIWDTRHQCLREINRPAS